MKTESSMFFNFNELTTKKVWKGELNKLFSTPNLTLMRFSAKKGYKFEDKGHKSEQILILLKGKFKLYVGNKERIVEEMGVMYIAPWEKHGGEALTDVEGFDIFHPKRKEEKYS